VARVQSGRRAEAGRDGGPSPREAAGRLFDACPRLGDAASAPPGRELARFAGEPPEADARLAAVMRVHRWPPRHWATRVFALCLGWHDSQDRREGFGGEHTRSDCALASSNNRTKAGRSICAYGSRATASHRQVKSRRWSRGWDAAATNGWHPIPNCAGSKLGTARHEKRPLASTSGNRSARRNSAPSRCLM
jgi:hypothetical protein